ncbi:solute carrier family 46 member 3-like isoform X3 [Haliotis rubra]|uniref:solute carrier family 46 member 3-like isoform X3 n=1 Tax=Haliotis rubra TaxID=36100 RepID=UPI001EE5ECD5|nr:solute carrier family 46 member 3-like isoform X3 [Haliotis rubra]
MSLSAWPARILCFSHLWCPMMLLLRSCRRCEQSCRWMAPPEMQGSLFAGIGLVNIISGNLGMTAFNEIYNATVEMLRGFAFFACAGFQFLSGVVIVVFLCVSHRVVDTDASTVVVINEEDRTPDPIISHDKQISETTT